jgi:serine protease Do
MRNSKLFILLLVIVMAIGLGVGSLIPTTFSAATAASGVASAPYTLLPVPTSAADEQAAVISLYARENPSVVNITIYGQQRGQVAPLGEGSGFVYDTAGHIVTNAHVVHGADQLDVTFPDGTVESAQVVGQDPNSDLAVVKVDKLPKGADPLALADMSQLAVGQTVVAIGNPFGLDGSLTKGIISSLGRNISSLTSFSIPQAIQTDAAINPGNSGGPLLDLQGHVVGVNAQIETGGTSRSNSGVGFAIPVSIVSRVVPELIKNGKYEWSWLGVSGGNVTPALAAAMQLPVQQAAYIADVTRGGPAEQAGLRGASSATTVNGRRVQVGGDVITAINGQAVRSFDDLLIYVALQTAPGQDVTLTVIRDGQTQEVKMHLGTRPATVAQAVLAVSPEQS